MSTSRRGFLKQSLGLGAAAIIPSVVKSQTNGNGDALDEVVIEVDNNPNNWDTRQLRDHSTIYFLSGLPASAYTNDSTGDLTDWELVNHSQNLDNFNPGISSNIIYTADTLDDSIAEQDVGFTYRAVDDTHPTSGPYATINDEIDRYMTNFTITYMANGNQEQMTFKAPNSVTKHIFGWDPDENIPYIPSLSYNRNDNPTEFESSFDNLHEILTDPDYAVQNSRITNRNTPSPCPDPNPWYGDAAVLEALAEDPMTVDDLYPTVIKVDMTDFKNYGNLAPAEKAKADSKYFGKMIPVVAGMGGARKMVKDINNFKMPGKIYESEAEFEAEEAAKEYKGIIQP